MSTYVNKRTQCGWNNWMNMSGILRQNIIPPHVEGNINNMIVQPAMLHGMETLPVTRSHVEKLEVTEMKIYMYSK